jgi:HlyD family secretion protein
MTESPNDRETDLRRDLESLRIDRGAPPRRGPRRWLRRVVYAGLGAALLLGAASFFKPRPRAVSVAVAERQGPQPNAVVPVLSGSGYIVTGERYVSIGVRVPGRIERYFVEEGQSVRAGDALVQLDDRDYRAAVTQAQAALELAAANRKLADAELERGRALRSSRVISQQELDVLENKAAVGKASVEQAQAALAQARVNLDYTTLRAPSQGVILAKLKEVGEIAVPGGFAGSGDLIRMANLSDMRAEVDVNEADLERVQLGQPATVTPDAYPEAHYAAAVVKLYPQVDRQKGTLKIEVKIEQPDDKLLPDMSARITFLQPLPPEVAAKPSVLVPSAALRRDREGHLFTWVVRDGKARRALVEAVAAESDPVRVTRGLAGGEKVVVSGGDDLREGVAVAVEE